jgi:hypothetical protein
VVFLFDIVLYNKGGVMGCGCGGGRRNAAAPKLPPATGKVTENVGKLHPNVVQMQNIQRIAEERRKVERLKREQLLKALARP